MIETMKWVSGKTRQATSFGLHVKSLLVSGVSICLVATTGCGVRTSPVSGTSLTLSADSVQGTFMGGQQPVGGVTVQLYQAGTTGYGSAATKLGPSVLTTPSGNFNLPSYSCSAGSEVYLVGTGGQPFAGTTNSNLAMMVGLGPCGGPNLSTFINVNELTTVATTWALAPFMTSMDHIGSSPTNALGLANAFAAINELVTTTNGKSPGPALPAGATLPITEINTLADILEQCINSGGGAAGDGTNCGKLFSLAPDQAGTTYPTDTITAAMNIAHSPGRNVAALNRLRSASPVFEPSLSVNTPPSAWTIAITYTGGGLSAPTSIAADASGNLWLPNGASSTVTKFDNSGLVLSGVSGFTAGGFSAPSAIAIDFGGNAWVANAGNSTVTKLSSSGATGTSFLGNGLSVPDSIAVDGSGNVWVTNSASSYVSAFTSSGSPLAGSPFTGGGVSSPVSVAVTPK